MANDLLGKLVDAIRGAKPEEREALRGALDVAQEVPRREELDEDARRALGEKFRAAAVRVTVERPKLSAQVAEAQKRRDAAVEDERRIRALVDGLDVETSAIQAEVYSVGWAGRPQLADDLLAELHAEAEALQPGLIQGPPRKPSYPGSPARTFSNAESCDARRGALLALVESFERSVARCELVTDSEMRAFIATGKKALPPFESPADVRDRIVGAEAA